MSESMRIVVPSRHRPENMPQIARLLPDATIFVHESERDDYAATGITNEIVTHTQTRGVASVRNAILETFDDECIVMVDDDLKGVRPQISKRRRLITDSVTIRQVIENGRACAADLGLGTFCWSRAGNPMWQDFVKQPFRLVDQVACVFGVRGRVRQLRFDEALRTGDDTDFTFRAILHDRIVLCDQRWYFDVGPVHHGIGGTHGTFAGEEVADFAKRLIKRWGRWMPPKTTQQQREAAERGMLLGMKIPRQNPSAVRL